MKIIERIINAATGETVDIERDMTADELAEHNAMISRIEKETKENAKTQEAKLALLEKLGITEDEAKLLLS